MTQFYSRNDVKYNGDVYSIPFDYIKEQEIQVYLDDVLFTDWSFLQKYQIKLNKTPSGITNKTIVSVRRVTDISKKEVDYSNNTLLDKASLNTSQDQLLHAVQEIYDNNIEFKDETTAQVASFEARVEEVEATTAESANIVAENAVLASTAKTNSEQAVATANSAYDTATEALLTSEQANSYATEARDSATIALDIAVTSGNKVDVFEESIETVLEAADKITVLEGAVGEATEAAQSAQEAVQAVGEMIDAIDGKANVDLDNLSEVGQAKLDEKANINLSNLTPEAQAKLDMKANAVDVLDKSQITNCITEIPQRIKYDIADGVITIKAGTIVIVPYGTEDLTSDFPVGSVFLNDKFKVVDRQFSDGKFFVWVELQSNLSGSGTGTQIIESSIIINITGGSLTGLATSLTTSSASQSTATTNTNYRTDLNVVQFTRNGALNSNIGSFPLLITKSDGVNIFASVSQVFNGMGYIGSTVWVDKGVKGLIPNGRNEDGTLRNIEFVTSKVSFNSVSDARQCYLYLGIDPAYNENIWFNITSFTYIQDTEPIAQAGNVYWFNPVTNLIKYTNNQGVSWRNMQCLICGKASTGSNGVISNFQPKQPFRAVDYNDFDTKVNKAGDTMTGNLTIDNVNQAIIHIDSDLAGLGSSPSGGKNTGSIYFKQKGVLTAIIQNMAASDGGNRLQLITRKPDNSGWGAGCNLITNADGNTYFDFPKCTTKATTTSTASGSKVAVITQNYVNGTSWYRVWSDGWIEQGGRTGSSAGGTARTVTLLKAFSNTNYYVGLTSYIGGSSTVQFNNFQCTNKTTSNFTAKAGCNESLVLEWYACGY